MQFPKKTDLVNLKSDADKLDSDKLRNDVPSSLSSLKSKNTQVKLSKLNDKVKHEVVKKTEYYAKIKGIKDKIPDITNSVTLLVLVTQLQMLLLPLKEMTLKEKYLLLLTQLILLFLLLLKIKYLISSKN